MIRIQNPNLDILVKTVEQLGELSDEFVYVGGCVTGLLITDSAAPPIRVTRDVDVLVEVVSKAEYYLMSKQLRDKGFKEDLSDGAPICRWVKGALILDVMPTDKSILGFGNDWYISAAENAEIFQLPSGKNIRVLSVAYFL